MPAEVSWILEASFQPGREKDFRILVDEMVAATRANTLNYEWSTSPDGSVCHIFERYVDSAAVMIHLATFGQKYASRFLEVLKPVRFVVYGSPNLDVKNALAAFNTVYMQPVGGFSK